MKRKPHALKVLQGTDQPCRRRPEPERPQPTDTDPPAWLVTPEAVDEWNRIVGLLVPARVLTAGDMTPLGHLCNMHGNAVKLCLAGVAPTASDMTQLRLMYAEFGLTPASRSKANMVPDDGESVNPFHSLNAKKGA